VGELFQTVVGGDSCEHCKPHPIMLRTAAERCGFDPAQVKSVMIGDTQADVQLGRAFGARSIWCAWGYAESVADPGDATAQSPEQLLRLVG
jgi:phosphoglycolate phosphatase